MKKSTVGAAAILLLWGNAAGLEPRAAERPPAREPIAAPTDAEITAVYPRGQTQAGYVELNCILNVQGKAQDCAVASERPVQKGFGAIALKLAPSYTFTPQMKDGVPTAGLMRFSIKITDTWSRTPTDREIDDAWPAEARRADIHGEAAVSCAVAMQGDLADCRLIHEEPRDRGFGAAALALTARYTHKIPAAGRSSPRVVLQFHWPKDSVDTPVLWARRPDPGAMGAIRPVQARGRAGRAVLSCTVTVRGILRDCWASEEEPEGLGFGDAAVLLAPGFVMSPAMRAGQPVEFHVNISIAWPE